MQELLRKHSPLRSQWKCLPSFANKTNLLICRTDLRPRSLKTCPWTLDKVCHTAHQIIPKAKTDTFRRISRKSECCSRSQLWKTVTSSSLERTISSTTTARPRYMTPCSPQQTRPGKWCHRIEIIPRVAKNFLTMPLCIYRRTPRRAKWQWLSKFSQIRADKLSDKKCSRRTRR